MKKILAIIGVLLIISAIVTSVLPVSAAFSVIMDSCSVGNGLVTGGCWQDYYSEMVFTASSTYNMTGVMLKLYKYNGCDPSVTVKIMSLAGSGVTLHETGVLAQGTKSTLGFTLGQTGSWESFYVYPAVQLQSGTQYGIALIATNNVGTEMPHAQVCWKGGDDNQYAGGGTLANGVSWEPNTDLFFRTYADFYTSPSVSTFNWTSNNNILTLYGKINSFGTDNTVNTGFEYGLDTNYGNIVAGNVATINNPISYKFNANIPINQFPVGTEFHYCAFMDGVNGGTTYGEDRTFTLTGTSFAGRLITLDATDVSYTSATLNGELDSVGSDTTVDLQFRIGTDTSLTMSPIALATGTANLGPYYAPLTSLSSSTTYYYEIESIGANDGTIDGGIKSFTTWDTNKPPGVNKGDTWLNKLGLGVGFWWIILAVLMGIPWIALHDGMVKQTIAVVIDLALLGGALALGIIDKWLFILLMLGAGVAAVGIIWRRNRE